MGIADWLLVCLLGAIGLAAAVFAFSFYSALQISRERWVASKQTYDAALKTLMCFGGPMYNVPNIWFGTAVSLGCFCGVFMILF